MGAGLVGGRVVFCFIAKDARGRGREFFEPGEEELSSLEGGGWVFLTCGRSGRRSREGVLSGI